MVTASDIERLRELLEQAGSRFRESERDYVVVDRPGNESAVRRSAKSEEHHVSISETEEWTRDILESPISRLALTALTANTPSAVLTSRAALIATPHLFNVTIDHEGSPVTNQRASGRCWLFAATNVFRVAIMRHHNLKEFELSQAWLFFWDKLERANYALEQVVQTAGQALDSREVQALLNDPLGDGGQWDMAANLVEKYGLVPQSIYPDSYNATSSGEMDALLTTRIRADALELRKAAADASVTSAALSAKKDAMVRDVHRILTLTLGPPPSPTAPFTWEYYDADDKYHSVRLTPKQLTDELRSTAAVAANRGVGVHDLFSLVNDPRNAYYSLLTVARLGNVVEGRPVKYVNVPVHVIKRACLAMLRAGQPVFFGCDVGQYLSGAVLDPALRDGYAGAFGVDVGPATALTKAERLRTGESQMTHAMVLTGVHVEPAEEAAAGGGEEKQERTVRWRIQNSWGKDAGVKGFYVMSDAWMDEFVYQAVVDPRFVDEEVRKVLGTEPKVLPLWDPMGALA